MSAIYPIQAVILFLGLQSFSLEQQVGLAVAFSILSFGMMRVLKLN